MPSPQGMHGYELTTDYVFHQMDIPGPPTYQGIISKPILFEEAFKSFNVGASRFPAINKVMAVITFPVKFHKFTNQSLM